jgi:hypothetical protein
MSTEKSSDNRYGGYLVLTLKPGEGVVIGETVVMISKIKSKNAVAVAVQTPKSIRVERVAENPFMPDNRRGRDPGIQ